MPLHGASDGAADVGDIDVGDIPADTGAGFVRPAQAPDPLSRTTPVNEEDSWLELEPFPLTDGHTSKSIESSATLSRPSPDVCASASAVDVAAMSQADSARSAAVRAPDPTDASAASGVSSPDSDAKALPSVAAESDWLDELDELGEADGAGRSVEFRLAAARRTVDRPASAGLAARVVARATAGVTAGLMHPGARRSRADATAAASPSKTLDVAAKARATPRMNVARDKAKPQKSLRSRAIGYLSRREHSRAELGAKLAPFLAEEESDDTVAALLDALQREGWLSDERYAESLLNRRAGRFGSQRILSELRRSKVDESLVQQSAEQLADSEYRRALDVWQKKFGRIGAPDTPQARAKQMRFLLSRGFSSGVSVKVLRICGADDAFDYLSEE
ncbi:recombination regulator RecX [Chitinasiproducens palmae]|uniref:recombination regulator RecX n=1 Tax=Chitinasiproducens palmae TaxID=1770053 RepID=UPI001B8C76B8|nr:recombination regulator RecX [Chitinasiproducens palmae]